MNPESTDPHRPARAAAAARVLARRVGLSTRQEDRLKARLRQTTCSEPWVEAQIKTVVDRGQRGRAIVYRYHDPKAYPPGGAHTRMVQCPACGVFVPPNSMEHGLCLDHARHDEWGPSPSALAFQAMHFRHLKIDHVVKLEPEDTQSLRREIKKYELWRKKCEGAARARKRKSGKR